MNKKTDSIIQTRLQRAKEKFSIASLAVEREMWNSASSALYYCCFNLIQPLFAKNNLESKTHSGAKILFSKDFVTENILEERWGKLFSTLFTYRQKGEYSDFDVEKEEILPLFDDVEEFKNKIYNLLERKFK